jgi:hypothetical protein
VFTLKQRTLKLTHEDLWAQDHPKNGANKEENKLRNMCENRMGRNVVINEPD